MKDYYLIFHMFMKIKFLCFKCTTALLLPLLMGPGLLLAADQAAKVAAQKSFKLVAPDLFEVPEGLEVTLWAHSPLLMNPTNMDVDAQGRIWVTEAMNYRKARQRPEGDRVVVLSDSDGDGVADKSQVFYQGKPIEGAHVQAIREPHATFAHSGATDAEGYARLRIAGGNYVVRAVWYASEEGPLLEARVWVTAESARNPKPIRLELH